MRLTKLRAQAYGTDMAKYRITNTSASLGSEGRAVFLTEVGQRLDPGRSCESNRLAAGTRTLESAGILKIEVCLPPSEATAAKPSAVDQRKTKPTAADKGETKPPAVDKRTADKGETKPPAADKRAADKGETKPPAADKRAADKGETKPPTTSR